MAHLQSVRDGVAKAIEPSLELLQRRLDECAEHPLAGALQDECQRIRAALDSWPQLVSAQVAQQIWARIDTLRRMLDVLDAGGDGDAPVEADDLEPAPAEEELEPSATAAPLDLGLTLRRDRSLQAFTPRASGGLALLPARRPGPIATDSYRVEPARPIDPRLALLCDPDGEIARAYRSVFFRIRASSSARSWLVTTPAADEDGSVCAANLALAVAELVDEPVLLVEARVAEPQLAELFGFEPRECFGRRLAQHLRQPEAPWPVAQIGDSQLHLLAVAGSDPSAPPLDIAALEDVVARFALHRFGYVVVAGPSTSGTADGPYLAHCAQGVILALHAGVTRAESVQRARQSLDGTPVLGYVLLER